MAGVLDVASSATSFDTQPHRSHEIQSRPNVAPAAGLVSVVVPCFGQLEFSRLSVPRLLKFSRNPVELLFVDVGSLDGTDRYLEGVAAAASVHIEVVRLLGDVSVGNACAAAAERARGEYVAFIANDALVSENWLNHLVALVKLAPNIGMVGCMSNFAPPPQWVGRLPYRLTPCTVRGSDGPPGTGNDVDEPDLVDLFARNWREQNRGQSFETERLGGPCLLMKSEMLSKVIPVFKGSGQLGMIDGERISQRVLSAGHRLACARDVFIHHFGSRPFFVLPIAPDGSNQVTDQHR